MFPLVLFLGEIFKSQHREMTSKHRIAASLVEDTAIGRGAEVVAGMSKTRYKKGRRSIKKEPPKSDRSALVLLTKCFNIYV